MKNHLGSASVVTDASGTILGENRYYPFGETRLTTGTIFTDKLFTGQREMAGLGIYHYGARFYSPKLGRFLSPDTIIPDYTNPQSWNRYSYAVNNPIRYNDPDGHCAPVCLIPLVPFLLLAGAATLTYVVLTNHDAMFEGISNAFDNVSELAKKKDVGLADDLQKKNKLERKDRRKVHDEISREGLTRKEIEEEFKELKRLKDKKNKEKEQDKE